MAYGAAQWQYSAALQYDGIIIDCNAQTVTRMSDGANLFSNINPVKDDYFSFTSGHVEIILTASGLGAWPLDLTMFIEFNPQNMG